MSSYSSIKVFISDDHAIVRKGISDIFQENGIEVVGESGTSEETLLHWFDNDPDVLIIDLNMEGEGGIQTIEEVLKKRPKTRILVFSMRENLNIIHATYQLGVMGYVTKRSGPELLVEAVKRVAADKRYYMPGIAEEILDYDSQDNREVSPRDVLSDNELKIFTLVAQGKSHDEIGHEMNIRPTTVANKVVVIRKKLGIGLTAFEWIARKYNLLKLDL